MIVDASALLAVILGEDDAARFEDAIAEAENPRIPSPNWLKVALVIGGRADAELQLRFEDFTDRLGLTIGAFSAAHAAAARQAWSRFGRGRHPAKLNFGDCIAYGFARVESEPLLFKGGDFALTDIEPALKE